MNGQKFLRRKQAADYLRDKYGCGSWQTLAKLAVTGDGPVYRKYGRAVVYLSEDLDAWALTRLGVPQQSTSDLRISEKPPDTYEVAYIK